MSYRTLPNGDIWFPKRGQAPMCPAGFVRTSDPYIFTPKINTCIHRTDKDYFLECGRKIKKLYCIKLQLFVNKGICLNCKEMECNAHIVGKDE